RAKAIEIEFLAAEVEEVAVARPVGREDVDVDPGEAEVGIGGERLQGRSAPVGRVECAEGTGGGNAGWAGGGGQRADGLRLHAPRIAVPEDARARGAGGGGFDQEARARQEGELD